jgi:predicted transcriptional regulator
MTTPADIYYDLRSAMLRTLPESGADTLLTAREIASDLNLPASAALGILRDLSDVGLICLSRACREDGTPCGSGWRRTLKGDRLLHQSGGC